MTEENGFPVYPNPAKQAPFGDEALGKKTEFGGLDPFDPERRTGFAAALGTIPIPIPILNPDPAKVRTFETGATRDTDDGKPDYSGFLSPFAIQRFGRYMVKHQQMPDGSRRSSRNWKKGIPEPVYVESLVRHVVDFMAAIESGQQAEAEELACAIFFNIQGFLHERTKNSSPQTGGQSEVQGTQSGSSPLPQEEQPSATAGIGAGRLGSDAGEAEPPLQDMSWWTLKPSG